ncbi:MAG: hypothetical protein RMJ39_10205 [Deltaproteobacteria bacterium]|nr:hypothetical protein [Deltaproteobacteria bacterium]
MRTVTSVDPECKWLDILVFRENRSFSKSTVEEKIAKLYELSGLKEPSHYIWCSSPVEYVYYFLSSVIRQDISQKRIARQKRVFLRRAEKNFLSREHFEVFCRRVSDNEWLISLHRGAPVKGKILSIADSEALEKIIKADLNLSSFIFKEDWGWLLAIYSEINRIYELDKGISISISDEIVYFHEKLQGTYHGAYSIYPKIPRLFPSHLLAFGFLPNKAMIVLIEHIIATGTLKDVELEKAQYLLNILENRLWIVPFENVCWIIEGPIKIKLTHYGSGYLIGGISAESSPLSRLSKHTIILRDRGSFNYLIDFPHSDDGPAIVFKDGFGIWAIDGVNIPPGSEVIFKAYWEYCEKKMYSQMRGYVTDFDETDPSSVRKFYNQELLEKLWEYDRYTPYEHLRERLIRGYIRYAPPDVIPAHLVFKERNAHIRSILLEKIGIEKLLQQFKTKIVDKWNDYELLRVHYRKDSVNFRGVFLKMKNPSTGQYHIEGVPPNIRTCKQALSWRIGGIEWNPVEIS